MIWRKVTQKLFFLPALILELSGNANTIIVLGEY